jgi:hypothetical protein
MGKIKGMFKHVEMPFPVKTNDIVASIEKAVSRGKELFDATFPIGFGWSFWHVYSTFEYNEENKPKLVFYARQEALDVLRVFENICNAYGTILRFESFDELKKWLGDC